MLYQLVAQGDAQDISQLESYESQYQEGDKGYLDLHLAYAPPSDIIYKLDDIFRISEITGYRLEPYSTGLRIHFKKGIAPLAIIAAAIAAVVLLLGILIAWKLYKLKPEAVIGWTVGAIIAVVAVAIAITVIIGAVKK